MQISRQLRSCWACKWMKKCKAKTEPGPVPSFFSLLSWPFCLSSLSSKQPWSSVLFRTQFDADLQYLQMICQISRTQPLPSFLHGQKRWHNQHGHHVTGKWRWQQWRKYASDPFHFILFLFISTSLHVLSKSALEFLIVMCSFTLAIFPFRHAAKNSI